MRFILGGLVLAFNLLDNATTYVCLDQPVPGYEVVEANPLARWLFDNLGLLEGLILETALTGAAVVFLVVSPALSSRLRIGILALLVALPALASWNNLQVIDELGIALGSAG